ncbi:MAG: hypothetical protein N2109_11035 [Fimbriimonadales bacterium]|nr:hypothetical protein [Fimbriimonadales bacterium]
MRRGIGKATRSNRRAHAGQTLIMAMIILGVLLILGFVFLGIVNRGIGTASTSRARTLAADLAEAGIRYAHSRLLYSELGADWRGAPTPLNQDGGDFTTDPDALYLRPGTGFGLRADGDPQIDLGGPDGLGPYTRVNFEGGRALVRVRFAPSDFNVFSSDPSGSLRNPGRARHYTIIESVGRPGRVNPNDPTTMASSQPVRFRNYASGDEFRRALGEMKNRDNRFVGSRKLIAFASIGIIESALYITNLDNVSRPAEIGVPRELGARYEGNPVRIPMQLGGLDSVYTIGPSPVPYPNPVGGGGSIVSNADLVVHGDLNLYLNPRLGDGVLVNGLIRGADDDSRLNLLAADWNGSSWVTGSFSLGNGTSPSLSSRSGAFSTIGGLLRDRLQRADSDGNARAMIRKEPPRVTMVDPDTGLNRYLVATRNSGRIVGNGNSGRFGHGRGVYVDNSYDVQVRSTADAREDVGTEEALVDDWLNPNNGKAGSAWKGPFYVPPGAFVQLLPDGFIIVRDGTRRPVGARDNQRTWRNEDGSDSGLTGIRFRIGDVSGVPYIINSLTPGANFNAENPNYAAGFPFNGLLFFEGNVRIRGVIPTDRQLTVVSMGTIYIEGSITKGVATPTGRLNRPSRSALMLMAKDYVALNTTQFFGPSIGQELEEVNEAAAATALNPVRLRAEDGQLTLRAELLLSPDTPGGNRRDPSTWRPFAELYREFAGTAGNTGDPLPVSVLLTHTMDDGPAPTTYIRMDVNYGLPDSTVLFPLTPTNAATNVFGPGYTTPGYGTPGWAPLFGLGIENWQRYSKFETTEFRFLDGTALNVSGLEMTVQEPIGRFTAFLQGTNDVTIRTASTATEASNDYLLARAAIVPHDVRIEASVYAEQGSFFVIPGPWFNPNPNDTRERYATLGSTQEERDQARLEAFGAMPGTPFYGEPLDVRVVLVGSVSQNMPVPISQQAEWLRKWGWIPREIGATGRRIPWVHVPEGYDLDDPDTFAVPNLILAYDPALATGRAGGFDPNSPYVRYDEYGRPLPPMPRLPVSPTLAYFGEVNP